jgi:hypothetical protein
MADAVYDLIQISAVPGGYVGVGVGVGGGRWLLRRRSCPSGYYRTEYQWVPTTVFAGYDVYGRPVYFRPSTSSRRTRWGAHVLGLRPWLLRPSAGELGVGFGFGRRWH